VKITRKIKPMVAAGLGVLLISVAPALSVSAEETVEDSGETGINVTATAETMAQCGWYMNNVGEEGGFDLIGTGKYIGEDYALTKTDEEINVYLSGSDVASTTCSTYGDAAGAELNVSWSGIGFADSTNPELDFTLADSPLVITYVSLCANPDWVLANPAISLSGTYSSPLVPVSISGEAVDLYEPYEVGINSFPSCTFDAVYSTAIPGDQTPGQPGTTYNFTGPTVTTTLVLQD